MRKFKALIHYIIHECSEPERLGAIRLNKALWFSDVTAYRVDGEAITTEKYVKRKFGPAPHRILLALNALEKSGDIAIREPESEFDTRKLLSLRPPKASVLSNREKLIASSVLRGVMGYTANEISEMSHDEVWESAMIGETIPLSATLGSPGEVTDDVVKWAVENISGAAA